MQSLTNTKNLEKLEILSETLHWLKLDDNNNPINCDSNPIVELYLDNHMLETFRTCEAKFFLSFVEGYRPHISRAWWFDFGTAFHKAIEYFYLNRKNPHFDVLSWATVRARDIWHSMRMDEFYAPGCRLEHKNYSILGGLPGFSNLLIQYATVYSPGMESWETVGTELYFGKDKSVELTNWADTAALGFRLFLSGKIDLLVAEPIFNGAISVAPMDHKTTSHFMGKNPQTKFEIHEGMTGYVYAAQKIVKNLLPDQKLEVNKIWMNHVQVKPETMPSTRFRRGAIYRTDYQLEQYRLRQISTAKRILELLLNYSGGPDFSSRSSSYNIPTYNTAACNLYHPCTFYPVHRQNSQYGELVILKTDFDRGKYWDPENREEDLLLDQQN